MTLAEPRQAGQPPDPDSVLTPLGELGPGQAFRAVLLRGHVLGPGPGGGVTVAIASRTEGERVEEWAPDLLVQAERTALREGS